MTHVLIGFATYRWVESQTVRTLVEMSHYMAKYHPEVVLSFAWRDGFPVAGCQHCYEGNSEYEDARNFFAKQALEKGCTHLFMIDSDMDSDDPAILAKLLFAERDVVAPMFIRRSPPYEVLALRYKKSEGLWTPIPVKEQRSGEVVEVDAVGFGCVLVNMSVLADMKYPWFVFQLHRGKQLPEDLNFCRKVRQRGYRIFVDTSIHLDHIGYHRYRVKEGIALQEMREETDEIGPESSDNSPASDSGSEDCEPAIVGVG